MSSNEMLSMKLDALAKLQKVQLEYLRAIASQGLGPYGNTVVSKAEKMLYNCEPSVNGAFPSLKIEAYVR